MAMYAAFRKLLRAPLKREGSMPLSVCRSNRRSDCRGCRTRISSCVNGLGRADFSQFRYSRYDRKVPGLA